MRRTKTPPPAGAPTALADWRDRRDEAQAKLAMLELEERERMLIRRDGVERAIRKIATAVITQFSSVADRISVEFGTTEVERKRIRARLNEEINAMRANLARNGALAEK